MLANNKTSEVFSIVCKELGVKEIAGGKHNARIIEYHGTTTLKAKEDEVSWCSAIINWAHIKAGVLGTNLANARSWLNWGISCVDSPEIGNVVVFWRESKYSWKGHVGLYAGETDSDIWVLGGNQNNEVCYKKYPKSQLLDIRKIST